MLNILKASAGSGKTFSLTREYLKMLLGHKAEDGSYRLATGDNDRHRHLLAVTFTNKATDEMKQRIAHELAVLAGYEPFVKEPSEHEEKLLELFGCTPEQLHHEAARALARLLFDFNYFHVSTIDSFFQTILRTFAFEAELEGDYEVDLDSQSALVRGISDLFNHMAEHPDEPATREAIEWLESDISQEFAQGKVKNVFNRGSKAFSSFVNMIDHMHNEDYMRNAEAVTEYLSSDKINLFKKGLHKLKKDAREKCVRLATNALKAMNDNPLPKGNYTANLVKALTKIAAGDELSGTTIPSVSEGKTKIATAPGMKYFEEGALADVYNAVMEACRYCCIWFPRTKVYGAILSNLTVLRLMSDVMTCVEAMRSENNVLLLSDTNSLLRSIIGDSSTPFIYERVGVDLENFLIDEFQDTSRMQWEIMRPLIEQSMSTGNDNLIIGDEKQSIYRFRGSDPSLIRKQVKKDIGHDVEESGNTLKENTNWRSTPQVVEFNNTLFSRMAELLGFKEIYSNVKQQIAKKNRDKQGYVSVQEAASEEKDYGAWALDRLVREVKREVLELGYKGSDICVLTRVNDNGGKAVEALQKAFAEDEELKGRGLSVISDDALRIDSAPSVRKVISALKAVCAAQAAVPDSGEDSGSRQGRLRHSRDEVVSMINHYEAAVGQGLDSSSALRKAVDTYADLMDTPFVDHDMNSLVGMSLPVLVEQIVSYYSAGGSRWADESMYLLALEDKVLDYCQINGSDIQGFLRWWDTNKRSITISAASTPNAVRVMSIHKSKGLEFKCVHLLVFNDPMVKFKSVEWFGKTDFKGIDSALVPPLLPIVPTSDMLQAEFADDYRRFYRQTMLDSLNVLYVAFTRAVEELIVSIPGKTSGDKTSGMTPEEFCESSPSWGQVIRYTLEKMGRSEFPVTEGDPHHPRGAEKKDEDRVTKPTSTIPLGPCEVNIEPELWNSIKIETPSERLFKAVEGTIMHRILSVVNRPSDIDKAVVSAVNAGLIERSCAEEVKAELHRAVESEGARRWFDGFDYLLNERHIVRPEGGEKDRIPDRVVVMPDGSVEIVDYKFGDEDNEKYFPQVRRYMDLYRSLGFTNVKGFIWYVPKSKITPVP